MTQWLRKYGMTPGRAVLMAVLSIALVAVWGPQLFSSSGTPKAKVAVVTPRKPAAVPVAPPAGVTKPAAKATDATTPLIAKSVKKRELPRFTASQASAYDPFEAPAWSPAAASLVAGDSGAVTSGNAEQRFEAIRSQGVGMILVSPEGKAAKLGDRTVRVGDQVDGFEVIDITPEGVVFMPASSKPEEDADGA